MLRHPQHQSKRTNGLTFIRQHIRRKAGKDWTCIVHLICSSLAFVSYKDRRAVAGALKEIYRAKDAEAGQAALEGFATSVWAASMKPSRPPGGAIGRR
jgi:putative transposase